MIAGAVDKEVEAQYDRINDLPPKLSARLDSLAQPGVRTDALEIAEKMRDAIDLSKGKRPFRIVVDPQHHGAQEINDVAAKMQTNFMKRFGINELIKVS